MKNILRIVLEQRPENKREEKLLKKVGWSIDELAHQDAVTVAVKLLRDYKVKVSKAHTGRFENFGPNLQTLSTYIEWDSKQPIDKQGEFVEKMTLREAKGQKTRQQK